MAPARDPGGSRDLDISVELALCAFDHISTPVMYLDSHLGVRYANRAASETHGLTRGASAGSHVPHLGSRESELAKAARSVLESGRELSVIVPFRPSGRRARSRQHLITLTPDVAEDGQVKGVFCEAADITELLASERVARDAESRLQHMIDGTPLIMFVKDAAGRYLLVNRRFEETVGIDRDRVVGHTDEDLFEPALAAFLCQGDDLVLSDGVERVAEKRLERGEVSRTYLCRKSPLLDESGHVRGVCGIATDISESERARQHIAESESRLNAILDSISDAFFALDAAWRFTWVNTHAATLLGKPREELLGADIRQLYAEQSETAFAKEFARAMEERCDITFEAFFEPTGVWTEVRLYPSATGVSAFFTDVTERRREAEERDALLDAYQEEMLRNLLLKEVANASANATNAAEVARRALRSIKRRLGATMGSIYELGDDGRTLHALALTGYGRDHERDLRVITLDDSTAVGRVVGHRLPLLTHETPHQPGATAAMAALCPGDHRWIAIPVQRGERLLGGVGLVFRGCRSFRPDELALLSGVAEQLAVAIENARLFTAQKHALERADTELETSRLLLEASRMLASSLEPCVVLDALVEVLGRTVGRSRVVLYLTSACDGTDASISAETNRRRFDPNRYDAQSLEAFERGESLIVDVDSLEGEAREEAEQTGFVLGMLQPLMIGGRLFGVLSIDEPGERVAFGSRDSALVAGIAAQASIALENARLYEQLRHEGALREAVGRIDLIVHSTLDITEVMEQVVSEARRAMGCDTAAVTDREGDSWLVRYSDGWTTDVVGTVIADDNNPHGVLAARTGRTIAIDDVDQDDRVDREFMERFGIRSVLVAPLVARGQCTGLIFFNYHDRAVSFSPAQIDFASRVAASISLALENARLYAQEHRVAETLQRSMLSIPARVRGVELGHFYHSATENARVGGDFYDVFELNGGRVAVMIGDVSGKGLDSSYMTALVKNALRTHAVEGDLPSAAMRKTNETVRHFSAPEVYVTVFFGILDTRSGSFTYCCAGHPSPMLVHGDSVSILHEKSAICGAFSGVEYRDHVTRLSPGDLLVLYTDGITEARDGRVLYGEERLTAFLGTIGAASPREAAEELFHEIWAYSKGSLRDDVALLAVRPTQPPAAFSETKASVQQTLAF